MNVVAGVFTDGDMVLACRRRDDRSFAGCWEFPGGKQEPDEAAEEALEREIAEELGVETEVGELLNRSTTMVGGMPITLACYFVRAVGSAPLVSCLLYTSTVGTARDQRAHRGHPRRRRSLTRSPIHRRDGP